ncbi:hypothetical protein SY88_20950 [Clostridiales bacterium PH28_bin88]|nr:hypothetical protein SY88_20950 [Clostridiales bacterium PH28_bin88]
MWIISSLNAEWHEMLMFFIPGYVLSISLFRPGKVHLAIKDKIAQYLNTFPPDAFRGQSVSFRDMYSKFTLFTGVQGQTLINQPVHPGDDRQLPGNARLFFMFMIIRGA